MRRTRTPTRAPWLIFMARVRALTGHAFPASWVQRDVPVFFSPASRAGEPPFFTWPKKGGPKKGHPGAAFFVHPWTKNAFGPAGLADAPSMARRQVGAIHCAHPTGLLVRSSPQHRGPRSASMTAIMASFEARSNNLLRPLARTGCASNGAPRTRRADDGSVRRMAHRKCASSPQAQGCAFGEPRRPLAHPGHTDVLRTCSRGGLSLGHLSLAMQRKVARPPGRRAKKDRDVAPDSTSISAASLECAFALQTALRAEPGIA